MTKLKINSQDILKILVLFTIFLIIFFVSLAKFGNTIMPIKEYIIDTSVLVGTNSILEQKLFWFLSFIGIISLFFIIKNNNKFKYELSSNTFKCIILIFSTLLIYSYKIFLPSPLIFAFFAFILFFFLFKDLSIDLFYLYIFTTINISSLIYIFSSENMNMNIAFIIALIIVLPLAIYINKYNKSLLNKLILIFQLILPLYFIIYLKNQYIYNPSIEFENKTLNLYNPTGIYVLFISLIFILIAYSIYFAYKNWNEIETKISLTSIITIASLVSFTKISKMIYDAHHFAEYIISYEQIVTHKNIPYITYFPISGLFPFVLGFLKNLLKLSLTDVNLIVAIFNIICIIIITFLLDKYLNKKQILFIALFIPFVNEYVRANLLLIYLLVLFLPALQKKLSLWLLTWAIMSYMIVFYYPIFGVAVVLASFLIAFHKIYLFFKDKYYIKSFKDIKFITLFSFEAIIFIISLPIIFGLIRHVLIYSKQADLANSIARFNSAVPFDFLPYFSEFEGFRRGLWYSIGYLFLILIVLILSLFLIKSIKAFGFKSILDNDCSGLSFTILLMFLISANLTIKRHDTFALLARSGFIIFPCVAIISIILLNKYFVKNYSNIFISSIFIFLAGISIHNGFYSLDKTYEKIETVDENNFAYIPKDSNYKNLYSGFVPKYIANDIEYYKNITNVLLTYDKNLSFLGLDQAYIVSLGLKTVSQPTMFEIRTTERTKEFIKQIRKFKPVIFTKGIFPNHSHDFYKWIVSTDEYVYSQKYQAYLPKDFANKLSIKDDNRLESVQLITDLDTIASNLGKSFEYLEKNYDNTNFEILYTEPINSKLVINNETNEYTNISTTFFKFDEIRGMDANYLYLELERANGNKTNLSSIKSPLLKAFTKEKFNENLSFNISWEEEGANFINCKFDDGRLFIPLEANINWLLKSHKGFKITVKGLDENESVNIKRIEFLKSKDL